MLKLILNRSQYYQGGVTLVRGDAWKISAQLVDVLGPVKEEVNLTGMGLTGWLPGEIAADSITVVNAECGKLTIDVTKETSLLVTEQLIETALFITASGGQLPGLTTIATLDQPVRVIDREDAFSEF